MTDFVVHGIIGSPYVRAAVVALLEKGLPWRLDGLKPGEHKGPAHLERHPFGMVPSLTHGDFLLYETQAMLRYIDRHAPEPVLTPRHAREEARMNQVIGIADCYVRRDWSPITYPRVVAPRLGFPADDSKVAQSVPAATLCMAELARLLGEHPFMAGTHLSLADIMLVPHVCMLAMAPEGAAMLAEQPRMHAWLERMQARPSMLATTWDALAAA